MFRSIRAFYPVSTVLDLPGLLACFAYWLARWLVGGRHLLDVSPFRFRGRGVALPVPELVGCWLFADTAVACRVMLTVWYDMVWYAVLAWSGEVGWPLDQPGFDIPPLGFWPVLVWCCAVDAA